jgi:hypothetical protein
MMTFSSPARFCAAATSKKPPQVRQFIGSRFKLGRNRFEHLEKVQYQYHECQHSMFDFRLRQETG